MTEEKKDNLFLCPTCQFGQFIRVCHESPHYGELQYLCKDMNRKKPETEEEKKYREDYCQGNSCLTMFAARPSLFDYEDGPGGWDGKNCVNYKKKEIL